MDSPSPAAAVGSDVWLDGHKHMEVVAWLKEEHGMGHGHANAVVAFVRAKLDG